MWTDEDVLEILNNFITCKKEDFTYDYGNDFIYNNNLTQSFLDNFNICSGATRMVFVGKEKKYNCVYKISYTNVWEIDYCEEEYERGREITDAGFGDLVLQLSFVGTLDNGLMLYKQKKGQTIEDYGSPNSYRSQESIDCASDYFSYSHNSIEDENWIADLFAYCGEERGWDFISFLEENEFDTDLHRGNYGYCNNIPCLIDYAGYISDIEF
jgi:hypothetical protein